MYPVLATNSFCTSKVKLFSSSAESGLPYALRSVRSAFSVAKRRLPVSAIQTDRSSPTYTPRGLESFLPHASVISSSTTPSRFITSTRLFSVSAT